MKYYKDVSSGVPVKKHYYYGQPIMTVVYDVEEFTTDEGTAYDYISFELPPYVWSYGELVSAMIRDEYTEDAMEAITNNYLANQADMEAMTKYTEMQRFRGHCKAVARDLLRYSVDNNLASAEFIAEFDALENTRSMVLQKIQNYNMSDNVDGFILGGQQVWLTKPQRESLLTSLNMFVKAGVDTFPFVLGGRAMEMPCAQMEAMLAAVEVYATQCMMVTAGHTAAVTALETEEAMLAYDYTTGYPEMLEFDV